ncbi:MAG: hypothetical protein A2487_06345 [Candidatus Raymondbacteria bacterium RifOxyC12_full_50_8]|uniref:ATPase AAA-type core domain-containing protein n=1 Tax=Candidatus Raymondbacteria bacterium RIFOXYD12_FULL_49_13 TaxID=1817890 RepID=A0A1F7FCR3_UNCRA|nr:MAG: hypothetical protein A2248_03245 [Candidatus Raymondbacteria bacterium RIFOXYA2_FULL_49_16]OGJ93286.1 MAG: hypothetical protein A2350_14550 [Candidatus Raymondbacteria bacterium RifOxyB12_full_50_8]OGK04246.1 MAG: hypothetical protein A2519_17960 [Candidatus Raymondbacteria bacterium RIFOXYD12_FULL_49_13]OGK06067.1 MAG: hypothetical protein A2487_06345 [Candidatus Raymondbacteria bacterium RifOxyC12_full_50_8]OGP42471.1 MAG: hypothetical protein A2324_17280 [Candidatus Raymondbacteria b
MIFSKLKIQNWKNFQHAEIDLYDRVFIVGPNASGKSNLLDVFRFLRDIARSGGGLQEAVKVRGGVTKIRCLAARSRPDIEIEVEIKDETKGQLLWKYGIGFTQTGGGVVKPKARLKYEKVWNDKKELVCERPSESDKDDKLLEYTYLEQPNSNAKFRDIADFFNSINYLHVVPQLLRDPDSFIGSGTKEDFYGRDLIERINKTNKKTREAFFRRIQQALKYAVPQFQDLGLVKDRMGIPHLEAIYRHWRAKGARQWEDQFSDGTLRFIGLFWALLDGNKPILLEEPELSLHSGIVTRLAEIISRLQQKKKFGNRQVILTTHSFDLLSNKGIAAEEVLMLVPGEEGTEIKNASHDKEVKVLLQSGMSVADVVIPATVPERVEQLSLQLDS